LKSVENTTVGDQISTVRKTNTERGEANLQMKEHAYVSIFV